MGKNLTWFARFGADERETSILSAAYRRSIVVLWLGLIVLWAIAKFDDGQTWLSLYGFKTIFALLIALSIMSGWWTLRSEELEFAPVTIKNSPSIIALGTIVALLFGIATATVFLAPSLTWTAIICFIASEMIIGTIVTWKWTKPYTLHSRVLASVLFPFQALGYLSAYKESGRHRLWCAVAASLYFIVTPFTAAMVLLNTTHIVSIAQWHGALVPGMIDHTITTKNSDVSHAIILNYQDTDVEIGDIIQYREFKQPLKMVQDSDGSFSPEGIFDSEGNFIPTIDENSPAISIETFGRVASIDQDTIVVDVSDGEQQSISAPSEAMTIVEQSHQVTIQKKDVVATVLVEAPYARIAEKLLW